MNRLTYVYIRVIIFFLVQTYQNGKSIKKWAQTDIHYTKCS
jgi:hypothetical protein